MGQPLQCGEGFVNIDPFSYDDPATGKRLLYWGSGHQPIKVQELAADRLSFVPGSRPIDLLPALPGSDPSLYSRLVEGAWVVLRDGWYYLFYSGDTCCGRNAITPCWSPAHAAPPVLFRHSRRRRRAHQRDPRTARQLVRARPQCCDPGSGR
jgi:hypothetical protein